MEEKQQNPIEASTEEVKTDAQIQEPPEGQFGNSEQPQEEESPKNDFSELKPGKRYRGSGMVTASGDFQFRRYKSRSNQEDEGTADDRVISEDELCQVIKYKAKIQIRIDVPLKDINPNKLFVLIAKHTNFISKTIFKWH